MNRRKFLKYASVLLPAASGCGLSRIDPYHVLIRSDVIGSMEEEKHILSKAKLTTTDDGRIRVLYVDGSPYERGYQHGVLLRTEIQDNLGYLYEQAKKKFHFEELFAEVYERMQPYIPEAYIQEMHGLAHGSRMPLSVIHHIHVLPSIGEWGGKKKVKKVLKAMMRGELGTSCSNVAAYSSATADGRMYAVRVLDWGLHRISKLHHYPLITVGRPLDGNVYANIGWVGFLGCISGMNAQGITIGEMGYKDPPNETLQGTPMPFMLRDVLTHASNLGDVRRIISETPGTNSFAFLMTDGKSNEAELYIRDRDRFRAFRAGEIVKDRDEYLPAVEDVVYGGHYDEKMAALLTDFRGAFTPEFLMDTFVPEIVMKSNFQNVIYDPKGLKFWVNNAKDKESQAARQPYSMFDLGSAMSYFD